MSKSPSSEADVAGRHDEDRFRAFLESVPDAVVVIGGDGRIGHVNARTTALFGFARDELVGAALDVIVPGGFERPPAPKTFAIAGADSRSTGSGLELRGRRKDGSDVPIEVSVAPLTTDAGELIIATIRDIRDRRRADEQRFRLASIVDSSGDAIIGMTLEGEATSWNEGARRIFGYGSGEIVGRSLSILEPAGRDGDASGVLAKVARSTDIARFETVLRRKDGREIDVSVTASPVRDARDHVIGASTIVRDVTERRRAQEALAHARDAAENANRELEAFSYSVAHDLRAPLRGMNGFAQILLDTYADKLDADGKDWLGEICANSKKMGELIDALLSLARLTQSELRRERVDLAAIARDQTARLGALEPARVVETVVADGLVVDADPRLAAALMQNLLGNAWKFTGSRDAARIEIGRDESGDASTYFVRDNGVGFDMAYASKLFGPFQRLHTVDEFPGTGIGLATVQRIVHRHGGRAWADGAVDRGATIYFTLPPVTLGESP